MSTRTMLTFWPVIQEIGKTLFYTIILKIEIMNSKFWKGKGNRIALKFLKDVWAHARFLKIKFWGRVAPPILLIWTF